MPLFGKKKHEKSNRKLEHKLFLARENPDGNYDISDCEINHVPSGVYPLCKVLQKEVLLAHSNFIKSLDGGGSLKDLQRLRILDLHQNRLVKLPNEISYLTSLQILNLENNQLIELPPSIGKLCSLQTLNLKSNKLKQLPDSLDGLVSLRLMDIRENESIARLPKIVAYIKTLESLLLNADKFVYPPPEICASGTEPIMKFLCAECSIEYVQPTTVLLPILKNSHVGESSSNVMNDGLTKVDQIIRAKYNDADEKRRQRIELERQIKEEQELHVSRFTSSASERRHLLSSVLQENNQIEEKLNMLHETKDKERTDWHKILGEVEKHSDDVLNQLMEMGEKSRRKESLLEELEKDRIEKESLFLVQNEESDKIRRHEILNSMTDMVRENALLKSILDSNVSHRSATVNEYLQDSSNFDNQLKRFYEEKDNDQDKFIRGLLEEESVQKRLFGVLQLQNDTRYNRISQQIETIEKELSELSWLEMKQKEMRTDNIINTLELKRKNMIDLLQSLITERDKRKNELGQRLIEMEESKEDNQVNYWLVQYQRLLQRKPEIILNKELEMDPQLMDFLLECGASEYVPLLAQNNVRNFNNLLGMGDADLRGIGIESEEVRRTILKFSRQYQSKVKEKASEKTTSISTIPALPSAPRLNQVVSSDPLPSQPEEIVTRMTAQCAICLDSRAQIIFLNCGHVCCCQACSKPLILCPLCRSDIASRILLPSET
ncbi:DgyrCDS11559 [Dimorphilus gyrociliatus]|uniref:DgyrCDS11559 n=1 Tax=Dimorphilus gyrociliatus TaxID=2664684 RepID=A0A7I8W694_9ANNE|nr:DgyrCDS11559 [Dimorphilus gyrociliatus]